MDSKAKQSHIQHGIKMDRRVKDITGKKYGKLSVISFSHINDCRMSVWNCLCDCGTHKKIRANSLSTGAVISCGCYNKEHNLYKMMDTSPIEFLYFNYQRGSKARNIEFDLTMECFSILVVSSCHYCGDLESNTLRRYKKEEFKYNGIDRKDSSLGYTIDNCVPCCVRCNFSKGIMTEQEFDIWIRKVYAFRNKS